MIKYIPFLRGKTGEFVALQNLDEEVLDVICPLIQFLPDTNQKRAGNYLQKISSELINAWNFDGNLIYFDTNYLKDMHFIADLMRVLTDNGINLIPVIQPSSPEEYLNIVRDNHRDNGIGVRIQVGSYRPTDLISMLENVLNKFDIEISDIDLIIDLQYIDNEANIDRYKRTFFRFYNALPNPLSVRRIILSSGSFPVDVNEFRVNTISRITRIEESLWRAVRHDIGKAPLVYGDYGNIHPIYNPEAKAFPGSCTLKYTSDQDFYIFRGVKANKVEEGFEQYHTKSKELIRSAIYDGRDFSWGDEQIYKCAKHEITSGNAGSWVKYTLNHHFLKVIKMLG